MNRFSWFLSQFLLVVLFLKSGLCLKCYTCDTFQGANNCQEVKRGTTLEPMECSPKALADLPADNWLQELTRIDFHEKTKNFDVPMVCQKIVAKHKGSEMVLRSCQLDMQDPCEIYKYKSAEKEIIIEHCLTCSTDKCNHSNQLVASRLLQIIAGLSLFYTSGLRTLCLN